jgi:5-methyltetrahydropteroyltriglutamate--homocysteine methyltransferase
MTYHSEVVGSLLRPTYLLEARQQYAQGQLSAPDFKAIEDRAVDEAITLQKDAGIEAITDGEMRRAGFMSVLIDAFEGFAHGGGWAPTFRDESGRERVGARPVVVERLKWRRSVCIEEWVYLRSRSPLPAKVTRLSAQQAASYYDSEKSKSAYPTLEAYLADIVDFSRREVEELIRLGCTYIQFDAPQYASLLDPQIREAYRQRGIEPDRIIDLSIELDNAIISDHPGITFSLHICRGNYNSMFYASGDYEPLSRVLSQTRFQRYFLEYDDERSGGFEPLRYVPDDRVVVLGLITTKKPRLESAGELQKRIKEAAQYVPLERLALSPQCGFASASVGNRISFEDQRRKLELVAKVAREVWGSQG